MAIRLCPKPEEPSPPADQDRDELARQLCISGTPASILIDNIERQTAIIDLAVQGFLYEFAKLPTADPRRRYALILQRANEQMRQDLLGLIRTLQKASW